MYGPRALEAAKKKLDEGVNVELDPDSSFDSPQVNQEESGKDIADELEGEADLLPEFGTTSSSILSELKAILLDLNQSPTSPSWDGSDPNMTSVLLNLVGEASEKMSNPFVMTDRVRNELVSRAEQAGARALSWDLSQFDKVGGKGTITAVWNRLKGNGMVGGVKRPASCSDDESSDRKKFKISLNISDVGEWINNIELEGSDVENLEATYDDSSARNEDLMDNDLHISLSFSDMDRGRETEEDLFMWLGADSIPPLASPEPPSTEWELSDGANGEIDSDSGMAEGVAGNVTNLCRRRIRHVVREGVITETGPYLPVSLGFNMEYGSSDEWEEILDSEGRPTGVERLSFKLNIVGGRTESLNEEWDEIRRLNGLPDDINTRRLARDEDDAFEDMYEMGYQADESEYSVSDDGDEERECDLEDVFGCPRATLNDHLDLSGGSRTEYSGYSRARLNDHMIRSCGRYIECSGCSRATLNDHLGNPSGSQIGWPGCSRTTLKFSMNGLQSVAGGRFLYDSVIYENDSEHDETSQSRSCKGEKREDDNNGASMNGAVRSHSCQVEVCGDDNNGASLNETSQSQSCQVEREESDNNRSWVDIAVRCEDDNNGASLNETSQSQSCQVERGESDNNGLWVDIAVRCEGDNNGVSLNETSQFRSCQVERGERYNNGSRVDVSNFVDDIVYREGTCSVHICWIMWLTVLSQMIMCVGLVWWVTLVTGYDYSQGQGDVYGATQGGGTWGAHVTSEVNDFELNGEIEQAVLNVRGEEEDDLENGRAIEGRIHSEQDPSIGSNLIRESGSSSE